MPTDIPAEHNGRLTREQALAHLRAASDHPLMHSFPEGAVFAFDHELRYLSAGGRGLADVGLTRAMVEGRTLFEAFPPETAAALEPAYREALAGSTTTSDVQYDGRTYTHLLAPVIDGAGEVVAGLGFTRDVSEARAAERHLQESDERIRLTSLYAPIGQAIVGLDGSWQQVNAAICELTGYSEDQLLQMTFQDITHPDDLDLDLAQVEKLLAGEITSYRMEKRYVTAAGHIVWVLLSGALVRDAEGEPLYFIAQVQDITAERTALRELAAERTLLAEAQRIGQLGSFTTDVRTGQSVFSAQVYRMWGLPEAADLGGLWATMIHPDDLDRVTQEQSEVLSAVGGHTSDYRIVRPDGAVRHLRSTQEVVLDHAGAPATILGTHLDITDLALARQEAVQANTVFASILTASPDLIFVTDVRTGGVVYAAPGRSILGITAHELRELGVSIIATLVHPDEQERLRTLNRAALDLADGDVQQLVYRARHTDGSWHWLDRRVTPFRRDLVTGQVIEVLGVVRDIDREHRLALSLRESEARLRALVTQVVDYAIIGLDPDGVITSWNSGAERLKGYTAEQAAGQSFEIFYTSEDRSAGVPHQLLATARAEGRVESVGWRVRRDGTTFWADVVITALHHEDGTLSGFAKVTRDMTDRHRLEIAQETLFATVTHDLRTPITAIQGLAEIVSDPDTDTDTRIQFAQRIQARIDHLAKLVDELARHASLRAGAVAITLEPLALSALASDCVLSLGALLEAHRVLFTDTDDDTVAMVDRTAMDRVLTNLLANAAKYSPAGSLITVTFEQHPTSVRVAVNDRGRGIAPEDLDTIFEDFTRGRLAQSDGGTGLGLASVKRLVELQGGQVWINSELGQGTTVTVQLPRAPTTALPAR